MIRIFFNGFTLLRFLFWLAIVVGASIWLLPMK